jgi:hypothetical protein
MKNVAAHYCAASWCGLVLVVVLGASSCNKEPEEGGKKPKVAFGFQCGDKTVTVDVPVPPATTPATPEAVYVCEDDVVTWAPTANVQTFEVEFKKEYPFSGNKKKFDKRDPKSPKTKHQNPGLTVYEYKLTVNGQVYDPQVVGGGN